MTRSAPLATGGRGRPPWAAIVVVGLGTVIVAALAFGLSRVDRSIAVSPSPPSSSMGPSATPPAPGLPTSRTFLDATLGPGSGDPLGPTTDHPVWFVDGQWWAALLDPPTGRTRLHRLASDGSAMLEMGRVLDERPGAIADALWANDHLYMATVVRDRAVGSGVRVSRYSADPQTGFRPDPDFPIRITERGVRSMALARDGAGRLWLAIVHDGVLEVAHSTSNDANWTMPAAIGAGPVGDDDVAGILAFGPGRLGVVWTSLATNTVSFAWRQDGDPEASWSAPETVAAGPPLLKDPISAAAGPDGSVLASVAGDVRGSSSSPGAARLILARREPGGTWNATVVGRVEDRHGPSAVLLGGGTGETGRIGVIATLQTNGSWVLKQSASSRLEFEAGTGAPLTLPAGLDGADLGGPHLAGGAWPDAAEVVVLGFDQTLRRYVHTVLGAPAGEPGSSFAPSPSPGPGGSPGPSASPTGGTVKELPLLLIDDTFDVFAAGSPAPNGWAPSTGDPPERLVVAAAPGHGNVLTLRSTVTDSVRACKSFSVADSGTLTATALVRLGALATADATITSLRLHGSEAALVRFGSGGTFAYYSGATKVRTAVPWKTGTWYRSTVRLDLTRHTYDWQLAIEGAKSPLVRVARVPFRDPAATAVDSICVQTSSGRADLGLAVDHVVVTR